MPIDDIRIRVETRFVLSQSRPLVPIQFATVRMERRPGVHDDEKDVIEGVIKTIKMMGYDVMTAKDYQAILDSTHAQPSQYVFVEFIFGNWNG